MLAGRVSHAEANRTERVRKDDQSVFNLYIFPAIGDMKAEGLGRRELSRMMNDAKLATDGRKGHTQKSTNARRLTHRPNRVFELVRTVMRWAVEQGILTANPMLGMKRPIKKEAARERALSSDEIHAVWHALNKAPPCDRFRWKRRDSDFPMSRATALAMKLSLATAQRIGEVSRIANAELDVNDTAPMWTVPGERSKNGEPNRVPLSPIAVQLIREARELSGAGVWLFPSPTGKGPIDPHAATRALGRARSAIGLLNVSVFMICVVQPLPRWRRWASIRTQSHWSSTTSACAAERSPARSITSTATIGRSETRWRHGACGSSGSLPATTT